MTTRTVTLEVEVQVTTTAEADERFAAYVGLEPDNEWGVTPGMTLEDVYGWVATSAMYGRHNANQDGFADLNPDSISAFVYDANPVALY